MLSVLFVVVASAKAQESLELSQLDFLTGHWTRTTDGMYVEQVFLPPAGGTVVGLQRRTREGATLVSYFFIIQQTEDGVVCRFKHFENDYVTYEDRNQTGPRTFALIGTSPASATFEEQGPDGPVYLRYRLTETDQLAIAVGSLAELGSNNVSESLHDRIDQGHQTGS